MGRAEFDVVVVGGGSAGCVVAARLTEHDSRSVALIEAGPDVRSDPPPELQDGWGLPKQFNWGLESEPDSSGRTQDLKRGKVLGGTSIRTRFAYRGAPAEYEGWVALGNTGWGFDDVLPYFNRLENDADFGSEPWHGDAGPIPVTRYTELEFTRVTSTAMDACEAVGFPPMEDHNQPGAVGVGRLPMTSRNGARVTTADAYLPVGNTPPNLTILPNADVADVLFESDRAAGIRLLDGTTIRARWVVLSAGVYASPALLMRSGIGPANHLRSLGITVRSDLPGVGANLADHPAVAMELTHDGEARDAPILHSIATFHSAQESIDGSPDLMLWLADPVVGSEYEIEVVLLRPRSTGKVWLRSADPTERPAIELPGVREEVDVERLAEAYRRAFDVASNRQMRALCGPPPDLPDDLHTWVRGNAYSLPHTVGTCAMGPSPEQGAVVDPWGRVHGTRGLSVIDASILPTQISGFTQVPTIMIAERLSEWLMRNL